MAGGPFDSASIAPNFTTSQTVSNQVNQAGPSLNLGEYNPGPKDWKDALWPAAFLAVALAGLAWAIKKLRGS